jgi:hypothetical protein
VAGAGAGCCAGGIHLGAGTGAGAWATGVEKGAKAGGLSECWLGLRVWRCGVLMAGGLTTRVLDVRRLPEVPFRAKVVHKVSLTAGKTGCSLTAYASYTSACTVMVRPSQRELSQLLMAPPKWLHSTEAAAAAAAAAAAGAAAAPPPTWQTSRRYVQWYCLLMNRALSLLHGVTQCTVCFHT